MHRQVRRNRHHVQPVDVVELLRFGVRGARHPRKTLVHLEVVLDRHRRDRLRLLLDRHAFLRLDCLVQPVGPLTTDHRAARVHVHDHHARLLAARARILHRHHDVVLVPLVHHVRTHRLREQVRQVHVLTHVERAQVRHTLRLGDPGVRQVHLLALQFHLEVLRVLRTLRLQLRKLPLGLLHPLFQRRNLAPIPCVADVALQPLDQPLALLHLVVRLLPRLLLAHQVLGQPVGKVIPRRTLVRLARDDQRRPRLVDQDRVHLVHDRKRPLLLHLLILATLHLIAQIVKAELARRPVHHVAPVHVALHILRLHVLRVDRPHRQPKGMEVRKRPVTVTLHQVVVHRHHVHGHPLDRRQIARQRSNDRLALARLHLRDLAARQHHRPDELHIERPGTERRLAHRVHLPNRLVQRLRDVHLQPARLRLGAPQKLARGRHRFAAGDLGLHRVVHRPRLRRELAGVELRLVLRVEDVPDTHRPIHRLPGHRQRFIEHVGDRLPLLDPLAKLLDHPADLLVAELPHLRLQRVDRRHSRGVALHETLVPRPDNQVQNRTNNGNALAD